MVAVAEPTGRLQKILQVPAGWVANAREALRKKSPLEIHTAELRATYRNLTPPYLLADQAAKDAIAAAGSIDKVDTAIISAHREARAAIVNAELALRERIKPLLPEDTKYEEFRIPHLQEAFSEIAHDSRKRMQELELPAKAALAKLEQLHGKPLGEVLGNASFSLETFAALPPYERTLVARQLTEKAQGKRALRKATEEAIPHMEHYAKHYPDTARLEPLLQAELKGMGSNHVLLPAPPVSALQQAKNELEAAYHTRHQAIVEGEDAVKAFVAKANGKAKGLFNSTELETITQQELGIRLKKLRSIASDQKGFAEAQALIPHMETLAEAQKAEDRFREVTKKLLPAGSSPAAEMDKIWNSVAAEHAYNNPALQESVAHAVEATAGKAKVAVSRGMESAFSSTAKTVEKSGHGKYWVFGGAAAAVVAIGAFMGMGRNQNHASRESERRNQSSFPGQGVA